MSRARTTSPRSKARRCSSSPRRSRKAAPPARAADADGDASKAQQEVAFVDRDTASVQAAIEKAKATRYTVEQRVTNGELLYRTKDYPRAVVVFSEIMEEFPDTPSYVDA